MSQWSENIVYNELSKNVFSYLLHSNTTQTQKLYNRMCICNVIANCKINLHFISFHRRTPSGWLKRRSRRRRGSNIGKCLSARKTASAAGTRTRVAEERSTLKSRRPASIQ